MRLSDFTFTFHFHALEKEMATHSSVLAWGIPGMKDRRLPTFRSGGSGFSPALLSLHLTAVPACSRRGHTCVISLQGPQLPGTRPPSGGNRLRGCHRAGVRPPGVTGTRGASGRLREPASESAGGEQARKQRPAGGLCARLTVRNPERRKK